MRNRDENKITTIKEKALEMVVKEGFDDFSMQKLAKKANVSPATIYIYFKDKEDLILQLYKEENEKMAEETLKNFHPDMSFSEGLKVQWINRSRYCIENKVQMVFLEQIRHSSLQKKASDLVNSKFMTVMQQFVGNAIKNGELIKVPVEVFWSVAFAPLYTLVRFHGAGTSIGGHQFTFSEEIMLKTLEIVLKGLKPV